MNQRLHDKKSMDEVSHEPLNLRYNSSGFLPDVELYRRGDTYYHRPSRSHFWLFGFLLILAVVVALLPWHTRAVVGELKYWLAGMFLFGGLCDIVGACVRSAVIQKVSIDVKKKMLSIVGKGSSCELPWEQIIGIQICQQKVPGNSELNGYQLNLVWSGVDGAVQRHCLLKHSVRTFVVRFGRRYESLFGFRVTDYTRRNQAATISHL